ncbi:MAG: hypothetical protein AAFZ65_03375 [Planctomycetota bacterium]
MAIRAFIGLALLAATVGILLWLETPSAPTEADSTGQAAQAEPGMERPAVGNAGPQAVTERRTVEQAANSAVGEPRAGAEPGADPRMDWVDNRFVGRIELVTDAGRVFDADGTAQVAISMPSLAGWYVEIDVIGGRFEFVEPTPELTDGLDFGWARLDGWDVVATDVGTRLGEGEWILEGRAVQRPMVEVVAAEDGQPLSNAEVRGGVESRQVLAIRLPELIAVDAPLRAGPGRSPFELEPTADQLRGGRIGGLAGAPDRVWRSFDAPLTKSDPIVVELPLAGRVDLRVLDVPVDSGLAVRLWRDDRVWLDLPLGVDLAVQVPCLEPGAWRASVERGRLYAAGDSQVFGRAEFEVVAGQTTDVALRVDSSAAQIEVPVAVELIVEADPRWIEAGSYGFDEDGVRTRLERLDEGQLTALTGGDVDWASKDGPRWRTDPLRRELPRGEHGLTVRDLGILLPYRIDGPGPIVLQYPDPVGVEIELVGPQGESLTGGLAWYTEDYRRTEFFAPSYVRHSDGEPVLRALLPRGQVWLDPFADDHFAERRQVEVFEEGQQIRIDFEPEARVRYELLADGERMDLRISQHRPTIESLGGGTHRTWDTTVGPGVGSSRVEPPGSYRATPVDLDGYVTPEPQDFEAIRGETAELRFEYVRQE